MALFRREWDDLARAAVRLRFPADVESAFRRYHSRNAVVIVRYALVLTALLFGLFAILDVYAAPLMWRAIWFIRFAVVIPALAVVLASSFHPRFPRILQPAMFFVVLTDGAGVLAMIDIASHRELQYQTYYAGLMLVIMAAHSIYRLRFVYATLSSALVVVAYELIAVFHQKLLVTREGVALFISNNFFFLSSLILGMAASYFLEVFLRRVFTQRIRLAQEQEKSERLLRNILPRETAAALKEQEGVIADHYDSASILFADVSDFTSMSARMKPHEVVELLNEVFSHFDDLAERHDLEKIKTIGDCYMLAAGVPRTCHNHAHVLTHVGLAMLRYVKGRRFGNVGQISLRIGINSGPVVAGVIGRKKFRYDLWGDTVNVASRMECHGTSGRVQITTSTYELIKDQFVCEPKGSILVKGKGAMPIWHVVAEKASFSIGVHSAEKQLRDPLVKTG
ncbi:MAG TPA: adenylate/guanylate cyclase domain-containing protein [Geobacteraceae bacterium]|nr:adenylate/guanylate cyclase domain-containing protein [Geobacteraceae bacterium]